MTWPPVGIETLDTAGDLRQQAHRHELGGADREAAHRQRQDREPVVARTTRAGVWSISVASEVVVIGTSFSKAGHALAYSTAPDVPGQETALTSEASASLNVALGRITASAISSSGS